MTNQTNQEIVISENNEVVQAPELIIGETIVRQDENFIVVKTAEGKFKRKAKYKDYSSVVVETKQDKIWLSNLMDMNSEDDSAGLKNHIGKHIEVQDIILKQYSKINEDTGQEEFGVVTYLITPDKTAYVTSSKSVYFKIVEDMQLFGKPTDEGWENLTYQVTKKKAQNGDMILIKLIG